MIIPEEGDGLFQFNILGVLSGFTNIDPVWDQNATFFSNLFYGLTFKKHQDPFSILTFASLMVCLRYTVFPLFCLKEARSSFSGLRVEVLKLQSRLQDKLLSPSYYIIISAYDQS